MIPLLRLQGTQERLDRPGHDPRVLEESLDQVADVNRWIGGRRALLLHLKPWIEQGARTVLDVGTGSGDLPLAVAAWCRRRGFAVQVTVVDSHPQIAALAAERTGMPVAVADGLRLPFSDARFDVGLLSLTLHHAEGPAQAAMLRELARVTSGHILVGELHRTWPNYLGSRLLAATLWRGNPLTRHDGPVSVLRAFTPPELLALAVDAGLRHAQVHRHLFYRLVLTAKV